MSSCTFKPKGMSYTEFLRSKKSTAVKVINTKKLQDASDITTQRRLGASQVFALNNDEVKGVINHPPDFSQEPLRELQSSYKTGGSARKPGDASDFTAYIGGQAIGKEIQAGLPDARITQTPAISLTSSAVPQSASDFTRRTQGCKESLGQPHQAATVTPPVFVDDTIRNLGNPTQCTTQSITRSGTCANSITTRPANHSIKAATAFPDTPNRPSQGGGQYALKGDREPGKEAGAFGGVTIAHVKSNIPVKSIRTRSGVNVNYKVGAALDNIPYVENHHGNDLGVNPKQPFVKYQIPGGVTPAHLKINKPISTLCCPTGRPGPSGPPPIGPSDIGTLTSPGVYTLDETTVILPGQTLTIPAGITLKIPPGVLLTNNGTIVCLGTIDNDDFTNNGTLTIPSSGNFVTTVLFTNSSTGTVTNSGTITITSPGTITNSGTIMNNSDGNLTNSATLTNNVGATIQNIGTFTNSLGSTFTNNGTVTNTGTIATYLPLTNYATLVGNTYTLKSGSQIIPLDGIVTVPDTFTLVIPDSSTFTINGTLYNNDTIQNSGTLTNNGSVVNNGTFTNNSEGTVINNEDAAFTNTVGSTFTNNGTYTDNGITLYFEPLTTYATLVGTTYTLKSPNETVPLNTTTVLPISRTLVIPVSSTFTINGTLTPSGTIQNSGTITLNNTTMETTAPVTNNGTINLTNNGAWNNIDPTSVNNIGGTILISASSFVGLQSKFTNHGTITNSGSLLTYNTGDNNALLNDGTITNLSGSTFDRNLATVYNYDGGIITVNGTKSGTGPVNNANGSGACGTGTLNGTNALVATGTVCPPA